MRVPHYRFFELPRQSEYLGSDVLTPIRTLLVVEDDPDMREYLTQALTADGYAVVSAPNGARALEVLKHMPTRCLVLTDMSMPVMSGWEFIIALQDFPRSVVRFPVIVLSGEDTTDAWRLPGVVRTISKPLKLQELREAVREECDAFTEGAAQS